GSLAATWVVAPAANAAGGAFVSPALDPWSGWNFNVAGGYHQFSTPTTISSESYSTDAAGGFLQVGVGHDVRMGKGVFGLHGDVQFGHTDARVGCFDSSECYGDINWGHGVSLTGRAGLLARPDAQVYGLFGWAWQNHTTNLLGGPPTPGWINGPTIGVGLETFVGGSRNMALT